MPATVTVAQLTGTKLGSGKPTNITTVSLVRLCTADMAEPGLLYPIPKPSAGMVRSYWVAYCLAIAPGDFDQVDNIRYDTDRTPFDGLGTGGQIYVGARNEGDWGCPHDDYIQATGTPGESGDNIEDEHGYYKAPDGGVTNLFDDEILVDSSAYTISDATQYTKHLVVQAELASDCSTGVFDAESCRFIYDDI